MWMHALVKTLVRATIVLLTMAVVWADRARAQEPDQPDPAAGALPWYQRHAVFRPALNIPARKPLMETGYEFPTRPLFLKGYAGYNYGTGPREVFVPTGYGTGVIQPLGVGAPVPCAPCFGKRWLNR